MEIHDATSSSFLRLEPFSYQFSHVAGDSFDDNWLVIKGTAQASGEKWNFQDPALLVDEAHRLGAWLRKSASGSAKPLEADADGRTWPEFPNIEPNIRYGLVEWSPDSVTVRFFLWLESAPPSSWSVGTRINMDFYFDLTTTPQLLFDAADAWEAQLARFPMR
jgi:hypothetical protein